MTLYILNIEGVNWTIDDYKDEIEILTMHMDADAEIDIIFTEVDFDEDKEGIALIFNALKDRTNKMSITFKNPWNFPTKTIFDALPTRPVRFDTITFTNSTQITHATKYNVSLITEGIKKKQVADTVSVDLGDFDAEYAEDAIMKLVDAAQIGRAHV